MLGGRGHTCMDRVKMERRETESHGEIGFVIDTEGATFVDPPVYSQGPPSGSAREKDEVEEKLEEILFGKQPFQAGMKEERRYKLLDSDSEPDEVKQWNCMGL